VLIPFPASFEIVSHVHVCGVEGQDRGMGRGHSLLGDGQLNSSMGLEGKEVRTLALKATVQKGFFLHLKAHTIIVVHRVVLYLYFSLLQVKKNT
jgi:hypothetical protein